MKPPICEVCNSRFDPGGGDQVSFVVDEATNAYDRRAEQPGFVGHRPNSGWFCDEHLLAARARSGSMTLGDAVRDITGRSGFRRSSTADPLSSPQPASDRASPVDPWPVEPVVVTPGTIASAARCATCGVVFPARAGGAVDFWVERVVYPPTFDYPNRRWFCGRHLGPAMMIRAAVGVDEARSVLQPLGRRPFEYDEVPPGVEIGSVDDHGEPMRGPFIPMPDERLHAEVTPLIEPVAPRIAPDAESILRRAIADIGSALGIDHLRRPGSTGLRHDPTEARLPAVAARAARAQRCATSVSSDHGRDLAVFVISARYIDDGAARGEELVRGEHVRLLVQQQQTSVLEVLVVSGDRSELAPDGRSLLDQVQIRVVESHRAQLDGVVAELVVALGVAAFDPFELGPDLDGVDLRNGVMKRSRSDRSRIEWALTPIAVSEVRSCFVALVSRLFDGLALATLPELERTDRRDWEPMDGSVAPHCPYVDHVELHHESPDGRSVVSVYSDQAHWNDHDISNVSAGLRMDLDGTRVSAYAAGRGSGDRCTTLSLWRPTSSAVIDALVETFHPWLGSEG